MRRRGPTRAGKWPSASPLKAASPRARDYIHLFVCAQDVFAEASAHLVHLHTAALWVSNTPRAWGAEQLEAKARTLLATGPPALRRVAINGRRWEVRGLAQHLHGTLY